MRTRYFTAGKGRWKRQEIEHIGEGGIETTILELLESIEHLENGFAADTADNSEIERYWDWTLSIEEVKQELNHILA